MTKEGPRECQEYGCIQRWYGRNRCKEHYDQAIFDGVIRQECIWPGECPNPAAGRGYCNTHHSRAIKKGMIDAAAPITIQCRTCDKFCDTTTVSKKLYCSNACMCFARNLRKEYKMSVEQYKYMLVQQDYKCAICEKHDPVQRLSVDHDHETGQVRALLCYKCNCGLGMFDDNPRFICRANDFIAKHKAIHPLDVIMPELDRLPPGAPAFGSGKSKRYHENKRRKAESQNILTDAWPSTSPFLEE